jgi:hemolysin III
MPELTESYLKQERANVITHLPGIILALAGTPMLAMLAASNSASAFQQSGIWLYGISMLMVYTASVLYHSVQDESRKRMLRKADHIAIYFLIAGTHTPVIFKYLDDWRGYVYLVVLWSLALAGIIGKMVALEKWPKLSLTLYLLMGWMFVAVLPFIWHLIRNEVLIWIAIGGVFYCIGAVFYARKRPVYFHAVWHLFVLAGTLSHFVAMWNAYNY